VCYKISILPRSQKEMLMRKKGDRGAVLWDLFRPTPQRPSWPNLPAEVRQKATRLLARLLREHGGRRRNGAAGKEVSDE
jgi:hypothetical protein